MSQQQAIEFINSLLNIEHDSLCQELSGFMRNCNCGKAERDVKLQELLDYLQGSQEIDFSQYFEFWVEE